MDIKNVNNYFGLVKFSHTIFALPFALIGFFTGVEHVGIGDLTWQLFLYVLLCMVLARNAAMAFNRYIDRSFDAKNPRTAKRHIPAGVIKEKHALIFVIINSILFIIVTYFINPLVFYLSPVALFVVLFYSYTKRFTSLSHFVLGVGLSLAPIGAYLSVTGSFDLLPIIYSAIVFFWVSGFDIIYAMQDVDFDKQENLKSIPVRIGKKNALVLSLFIHIVTISLVIWAGFVANYGLVYWIGAISFVILLLYQHTIVKPNDLSRVNLAFFTLNGIASVIFSVFTIAAILLQNNL